MSSLRSVCGALCTAAIAMIAGCRGEAEVDPTLGNGTSTQQLSTVTDGRALGSSSQGKLLVDGSGRGYIAVRSHVGQGQRVTYGIALLRTVGPALAPGGVQSVFLSDAAGVEVSRAAQSAPSMDTTGDGTFEVAFSGGSLAQPAHQLRIARFRGSPDLAALSSREVLNVTGFEAAYPAATGNEAWQELPSAVFDTKGRLHLAWEARDATRFSGGKASPGIAHLMSPESLPAARVARPPYLYIDTDYPEQHRPVLVSDTAGGVHVLASGSLGGPQQALYGHIDGNGIFSGWNAIAANSAKDQRHVVGARDSNGNLWAAWREGVPGASATGGVAVVTARLKPLNTFEPPITVSSAAENASAPSIAVDDGAVRIAWVGWTPGILNSESHVDNGFPEDEGAIEGTLRAAERREEAKFRTLNVPSPTTASFPVWANGPSGGPGPRALLWTEGFPNTCPGTDCVLLQLGLPH